MQSIIESKEELEKYIREMIKQAQRHGVRIQCVLGMCPNIESGFSIGNIGKSFEDVKNYVVQIETLYDDLQKKAEQGLKWALSKSD